MIRSVLVASLVLIFIPACPPSPSPPPGPVGDAAVAVDASVGTTLCAVACRNLADIGCAEGRVSNCASVCEKAQAERITDLHPACLSIATTKADARACKSVACP